MLESKSVPESKETDKYENRYRRKHWVLGSKPRERWPLSSENRLRNSPRRRSPESWKDGDQTDGKGGEGAGYPDFIVCLEKKSRGRRHSPRNTETRLDGLGTNLCTVSLFTLLTSHTLHPFPLPWQRSNQRTSFTNFWTVNKNKTEQEN